MERSLVQLENGIKPLSSVMSKLETLQFGHSSWPNSKSLFYSTPLVDDCVESSHLPFNFIFLSDRYYEIPYL